MQKLVISVGECGLWSIFGQPQVGWSDLGGALVADIVERQHISHSTGELIEKEYYIKNNVAHIPRLAPHSGVNAEFAPRLFHHAFG